MDMILQCLVIVHGLNWGHRDGSVCSSYCCHANQHERVLSVHVAIMCCEVSNSYCRTP